MSCRKRMHRTKAEAEKAARDTRTANLDVGRIRVYRCRTCRLPDRARAWHWGHLARGRAR